MKTLKTPVCCPRRDVIGVQTVYTQYDEEYHVAVCNGCDRFNGSRLCQLCTAQITLMYMADPVHLPPAPIQIQTK